MDDGALNSGADILHVRVHVHENQNHESHESQNHESHENQNHENQNPMSDQIQSQSQHQIQNASSYSSVCQSPPQPAHAERLSVP
jgi:hypothetical protein